MKKSYLFIFSLLTAIIAQGQSIQIVDINGVDISGSTQTHYHVNSPTGQGLDYPVSCADVMNTNTLDVNYDFGIKNTTNADMDIKVVRYEMSYDPSAKSYFCWKLCYGEIGAGLAYKWPTPPNPSANDFRTVAANSIDTNLYAHYKPYGGCSFAKYRYVAFDANNPNDSAWIDVEFDFPVGIEERSITASEYPNPVSNILNINVDASTYGDLQLTLYNILGEKITEQKVVGANIQLNVGIYTPGVYFYSISDKNGILTTRKVRIER